MPNALDHRLGAAIAAGSVAVADWHPDDHWSKHPLIVAVTAWSCGTLPDIIEPAINPNHRRFFHSLVFAGLLAVTMVELHRWEPQTGGERALRYLLLTAGGAYGVHLIMDSFTSKSLPVM